VKAGPFVVLDPEEQADKRLLEVALEGLPATGFSVLGTSAAHDPASFVVPAGSRVEAFVSHEAVLDRAACVVCHGGMGITQKTLAAGVPLVIVPFGRDQLETARRLEVARAGRKLATKRLGPRTSPPGFARRSTAATAQSVWPRPSSAQAARPLRPTPSRRWQPPGRPLPEWSRPRPTRRSCATG
jgi:hypothetical protein